MHSYDSDKYEMLSKEYPNVIKGTKIYVLPFLIQAHAIVDVFLTDLGGVKIESQYHPIRHGRHCGSAVRMGTSFGKIDYNPRFIWNGKEWFLQTYGTFVFDEIEINEKPRSENER
jgi:hypothetical protein